MLSQQGGGPKRSLDLGIPAEKKTLFRQEGTTEPELADHFLSHFLRLLTAFAASNGLFGLLMASLHDHLAPKR